MRNLMNNSLRMLLSAFLLMILLSCQDKAKEEKQYSPITQKLVDLVKSDERIKSLLMEAIEKGKKINPLIGNAGVSAVPMSARISNNIGLEYDSSNYLLMHAMGPNVAGVIGSAVAAGALLGFLG